MSEYTVNLTNDPYLAYRILLADQWPFLQGARRRAPAPCHRSPHPGGKACQRADDRDRMPGNRYGGLDRQRDCTGSQRLDADRPGALYEPP